MMTRTHQPFARVLGIAIVASALALALVAQTATAITYRVAATHSRASPVLSYKQGNSEFPFTYNSAAFANRSTKGGGNVCLLVRCQNLTSGSNPLGHVGPSVIAISCSSSRASGFSPIKKASVVFSPTGPREVLGTEDPRVSRVNDTLYMFYTAVAYSPAGGATARLSLATCADKDGGAAAPSCWRRRGALFPDPTPGFQFTKSGALLHDPVTQQSLLIYGDSTIVVGLQVAVPSADLLRYETVQDFVLITTRPRMFDSELVESGPPPLRLPTGDWFFIYNSAQRLNGVPNRLFYNPGYVILNGSNPMQVLQRSAHPLMMPTYEYQTSGLTPYVVFVEGMLASSPPSQQQPHRVRRAELSAAASAGAESGSVSFDIYYGAADSAVGHAVVTVSY